MDLSYDHSSDHIDSPSAFGYSHSLCTRDGLFALLCCGATRAVASVTSTFVCGHAILRPDSASSLHFHGPVDELQWDHSTTGGFVPCVRRKVFGWTWHGQCQHKHAVRRHIRILHFRYGFHRVSAYSGNEKTWLSTELRIRNHSGFLDDGYDSSAKYSHGTLCRFSAGIGGKAFSRKSFPTDTCAETA